MWRTLLLLLLLVSCSSDTKEQAIIYLTWQHAPESSMTIHWIDTNPSHEIYYRQKGTDPWLLISGTTSTLPENAQPLLHQVDILHLQPDTTYEFHLAGMSAVHQFKTVEKTLKKPLQFVVGGDFYHNFQTLLRKTAKTAASYSPAFALVGGDIAYSTDKLGLLPDDLDRWLTFLKIWQEEMVTPDGNMIPMLPTIGNEDTKKRFEQTPSMAALYYAFFPTSGYRVIDMGDYLSLWILDSGHTHPIDGKQKEWLANTLEKRRDRFYKMALYHVPAYPSYRPYEFKYSAQIRKNWVPLFEKYHLHVAFENHDHAYKRSQLIRDGKIDPDGILYLGDGGFGIGVPRIPATPSERWYLAETASERHFILVTLFPDGKFEYQAISSDNRIFDVFWDKRAKATYDYH